MVQTYIRGGFQLNQDSTYISITMNRTDFANKIPTFLLPFPNVLYFIQKIKISTRFAVISFFRSVGVRSQSGFFENFAISPVRATSFSTSPRLKNQIRGHIKHLRPFTRLGRFTAANLISSGRRGAARTVVKTAVIKTCAPRPRRHFFASVNQPVSRQTKPIAV